jgi:hypothetical protein
MCTQACPLCIEDWAFSEKSSYLLSFISFYLLVYSLAVYTSKYWKNTLQLLLFLRQLVNQFLQLLVGPTTFYLLKGTTIKPLQLWVISSKRSGRRVKEVMPASLNIHAIKLHILPWWSLDDVVKTRRIGMGKGRDRICAFTSKTTKKLLDICPTGI